MKRIIFLLSLAFLALTLPAQITDIQVRLGGDAWKLSYTASSAQINCGLCPQIIGSLPGAEGIIHGLQDSVSQYRYNRTGINLAISASLFHPAIRAELQLSPSMRKLNTDADQISRYANRNVSAFIGVNPMQFDDFMGRYYLGRSQQLFLDLSDVGVYAQFSFDGGFEEYARSVSNVALLARWQPTVWLTDERKVGISLRTGGRLWLLGNRNPEWPIHWFQWPTQKGQARSGLVFRNCGESSAVYCIRTISYFLNRY